MCAWVPSCCYQALTPTYKRHKSIATHDSPENRSGGYPDGRGDQHAGPWLSTPLQVKLHLTLALEASYQTGDMPVTAELVETVLSRQLYDLEPTQARHSYQLKHMTEQFDAMATEIRAMFSYQLEPKRTAEIRERMLAASLPI